jgi:hypothetical protein
LRLLEVLAAARKRPELAVFRGRMLEALVYQHISSRAGSWTARSLDGGAGLFVPLPGKEARDYDDIDELRPGKPGEPSLWRPRSETNAAVDFIITNGRQVYFLQCTVSDSHDIVVRTFTGKNRGLIEQADVLMRHGFDTAGDLNFVHVTEAATEPVYVAGRLTVGQRGDESGAEAATADGSAGAMAGMSEASGTGRGRPRKVRKTAAGEDRVKQFVVGFVASAS